jgi:hypothetical protein
MAYFGARQGRTVRRLFSTAGDWVEKPELKVGRPDHGIGEQKAAIRQAIPESLIDKSVDALRTMKDLDESPSHVYQRALLDAYVCASYETCQNLWPQILLNIRLEITK